MAKPRDEYCVANVPVANRALDRFAGAGQGILGFLRQRTIRFEIARASAETPEVVEDIFDVWALMPIASFRISSRLRSTRWQGIASASGLAQALPTARGRALSPA